MECKVRVYKGKRLVREIKCYNPHIAESVARCSAHNWKNERGAIRAVKFVRLNHTLIGFDLYQENKLHAIIRIIRPTDAQIREEEDRVIEEVKKTNPHL